MGKGELAYYDNPVAFFEDILEMQPDEWQKSVLNDLVKYPKVSVRSGQGVGKTAPEAGAIIWFLVCRPYSRVIEEATIHGENHCKCQHPYKQAADQRYCPKRDGFKESAIFNCGYDF